MRITDGYTRAGIQGIQGTRSARPSKTNTNAEPTAGDEGDRIQLSAQSVELSRQVDGDIDTARVARLKDAIQSGTFQIDAYAIAEKILQGS